MNRQEILNKINKNPMYEYNIAEVPQRDGMLLFYLKEDLEGKSKINFYEKAVDLIYSAADIYDVTLVEWSKCRALSYYKKDGLVDIGLEDFDIFARKSPEKVGYDIVEFNFSIKALKIKNLEAVSYITCFEDLINYIVKLVYTRSIQTSGWYDQYDYEV
ncbi:hypothetical protein MHL30_19755 [Priestia flexa]|uniref:hypothetical protein n=1 Tax=Priestia flexa TaxID=86664 RepID=UPI001EF6F8EE|nr:hypothetical protein [Priestia flexa]MCG7315331.1 hypothetical protein [Priestia flexa]